MHNSFNVEGTDCAGFIYKILDAAGMKLGTISDNVNSQNFYEAIKPELESQFNYLKLEKHKPSEQKKDGDILFYKSGHLTFYYDSKNPQQIQWNSNGVANPKTKAEQETNYKDLKKRGVHAVTATYFDKSLELTSIYRIVDMEVKTEPVQQQNPKGAFPRTVITDSSANLGGEVVSGGSTPILSRGICYSTNISKKPTVFNLTKPDSGQLGTFSTQINKLLPGTKYAARAYAINQTDTAYGGTIVFDTKGNMDTLATLMIHGEWRGGEGVFDEDTLGKLYTYISCGHKEKYRVDSINFILKQI